MENRTLIAIPLMMGLVLLTMGCGDSILGPTKSIPVTPKTATLTAIGATVQLVAKWSNGMFGGFVWDSWEEDVATVATVDSGGNIREGGGHGLATAVANGSTSICAHTVGFIRSGGCATLTVAIP